MPQYAFLFAFFAKSKLPQDFAIKKFNENPDVRFTPRMAQEIDCLCKDSIRSLESGRDASSRAFLAYLKKI